MSERQLYIRVRGRVLGPFEDEKLQTMARRGQFSRMHEVSADGLTWVRASVYPELFAGGPPASEGQPNGRSAAAEAVAAAPTGGGEQYHVAADSPPAAGASSHWYYTSGGREIGPVGYAAVQAAARSGQLGPDDMVWTDGMVNWKPATEVAGLLPAATASVPAAYAPAPTAAAGTHYGGAAAEDGAVADGVVRVLGGTRPWVLFVAIYTSVGCVLQVVLGVVLLVWAGEAGLQRGLLLGQGIGMLITAVLMAVGAWFLFTHCARVGELRYSRSSRSLEAALAAMRAFWVYVGILLIVYLAIAALIGLMLITVVGSVAGSF